MIQGVVLQEGRELVVRDHETGKVSRSPYGHLLALSTLARHDRPDSILGVSLEGETRWTYLLEAGVASALAPLSGRLYVLTSKCELLCLEEGGA